MSYARIDDLLPHHRKIMGCGARAIACLGLYAAGLAYCQRHETDGLILAPHLALLVPAVPRPPRVLIETLVTVGLWEPVAGGWQVHDYLAWNDSHADRATRRVLDAARKRGRGTGTPRGIQPESDRNPDGLRDGLRTDSLRPSSPLLSSPEKKERSDLVTAITAPPPGSAPGLSRDQGGSGSDGVGVTPAAAKKIGAAVHRIVSGLEGAGAG